MEQNTLLPAALGTAGGHDVKAVAETELSSSAFGFNLQYKAIGFRVVLLAALNRSRCACTIMLSIGV